MYSDRIALPDTLRALAAVLLMAASLAAQADMRLDEVCEIVVANDAHAMERSSAELLRKTLAERYGARPTLRSRSECRTSIFVGRGAAEVSGLVKTSELPPLGPDGFVLRSRQANLAITGGGPAGTLYGAYEFLRRIGVRYYPWEFGESVETFSPVPGGFFAAIDVVDRPYFEYRDVVTHVDRGRNGTSFRELTLGDMRFDDNNPEFIQGGWLAWDHTAGWLVPMTRHFGRKGLYPEMSIAERLNIKTINVAVCQCHPDAAPLATERALEWIGRQPERRYFAITDGDVDRPRCPVCQETDPYPDYYTDRLLRWVNEIASNVGAIYPDKTFLTLAYQSTAKPPVDIAPNRNVLVMYAPWYWESRSSPWVPLEHPLNLKAAEELSEWTGRFPGQVAIYDYPVDGTHATADRIKDYANKGIRWVYQNAPQSDLLRWVSMRLLWNPTLPAHALIEEFCEAQYGPAADVMLQYYELLENATQTRGRYYRRIEEDPAFVGNAWRLIRQAEAIAVSVDPGTRARIRVGAAAVYERILAAVRSGQIDQSSLPRIAEEYVRLRGQVFSDLEAAGSAPGVLDSYVSSTRRALEALGFRPESNTAGLDEMLAAALTFLVDVSHPVSPTFEQVRGLHFDGAGEVSRWKVSSTSGPVSARLTANSGIRGDVTGVGFRAELTKLPTGKRGSRVTPFGRVSAERKFDTPIRISGNDSLYLRLVASDDSLATIYISVEGQGLLKSDVTLGAGEQIVRVQLGNYRQLAKRTSALTSLAIDFWPQSLVYPYPVTKDIDVVLAGLEIRPGEPDPASLPHRGSAIWLSSFHANIKHGDGAIGRAGKEASAPGSMLQLYGRSTEEDFRTFTSHRVLAPIVGIVASPDDAGTARYLRNRLKRRFGVELPLLSPTDLGADSSGNLIWLGRDAMLDGGWSSAELERASSGTLAVLAQRGRVGIDGSDAEWRRDAVDVLMTSQGTGVAKGVTLPPGIGSLMTELYVVERPLFGSSVPTCRGVGKGDSIERIHIDAGVAQVREAALRGIRVIPPDIVALAGDDTVSCRAIRQVARRPFAE